MRSKKALKARNRFVKRRRTSSADVISRFQRLDLQLPQPGPMAQAVTFRAFGAVNPSFDTNSVARVISTQSRFAEVEKTFAAKPADVSLLRLTDFSSSPS